MPGKLGSRPWCRLMIRPPAYFQQLAGEQDAHVAGQDDVIDVVLVAQRDQSLVVGHAFGVADHFPGDAELLGQRRGRRGDCRSSRRPRP